MKKYALVIVAVIMVLTASAFVIANKSNTGASTSSSTYWFQMDESGTSVTTTQLSNPDDLCPDKLTEPDCARQFSESQTEVISGVRHVKASETNNYIDFRSKD